MSFLFEEHRPLSSIIPVNAGMMEEGRPLNNPIRPEESPLD
jgi:hypothetical protein